MTFEKIVPGYIHKILYFKSGEEILDKKLLYRRYILTFFMSLIYGSVFLYTPAIPLEEAESYTGELLRVSDIPHAASRGSPLVYVLVGDSEIRFETRSRYMVDELSDKIGTTVTIWSQRHYNLLLLPGAHWILDVEVNGTKIRNYSIEHVERRKTIMEFLFRIRWIGILGVIATAFSLYRLALHANTIKN